MTSVVLNIDSTTITRKYYENPSSCRAGLTTVTLTRKGQTTIPKDLREKYDLVEGTKLQVVDTGEGVMFRKALSTVDLIGSSRKTFEEMKRQLYEIRREDA
jgi:AbrB family looped-hinge helix DNA binding protein